MHLYVESELGCNYISDTSVSKYTTPCQWHVEIWNWHAWIEGERVY